MMSEKRYKRFYVSESENQLTIYDNEGLDDYYHLGDDERDVKGICKLLNEQQSTIDKLDQENADLLGARIKAQEEWEKCTDKLKEKIVEQQDTINKLRKILAEAEDTIEVRLAEHYLKEYENIKHNIIGDTDG